MPLKQTEHVPLTRVLPGTCGAGTEAPVITPNGVDFSFLSFLYTCGADCLRSSPAITLELLRRCTCLHHWVQETLIQL